MIYTPPYCPFSSPLSTHHNCQYLVRYEAEKEKGGKRKALQMDITAVFACGAWKGGFSHTSRIFTVPSAHYMVCCKCIL